MANTKSSKKRALQNQKKRAVNLIRRSGLKTVVKKVLRAVDANDDIAKTKELLRDAESKIARASGKGLLHKKTASRRISRLARRVAQLEKPASQASA